MNVRLLGVIIRSFLDHKVREQKRFLFYEAVWKAGFRGNCALRDFQKRFSLISTLNLGNEFHYFQLFSNPDIKSGLIEFLNTF